MKRRAYWPLEVAQDVCLPEVHRGRYPGTSGPGYAPKGLPHAGNRQGGLVRADFLPRPRGYRADFALLPPFEYP